MKQLLTEIVLSDDDWFEHGGTNERYVQHVVGEHAYYNSQVSFELEFVERNFDAQTQVIRIYIVGNYKQLMWFRLQYTPKIT